MSQYRDKLLTKRGVVGQGDLRFLLLGHVVALDENAGHSAVLIVNRLIDKVDIALTDRASGFGFHGVFCAEST